MKGENGRGLFCLRIPGHSLTGEACVREWQKLKSEVNKNKKYGCKRLSFASFIFRVQVVVVSAAAGINCAAERNF